MDTTFQQWKGGQKMENPIVHNAGPRIEQLDPIWDMLHDLTIISELAHEDIKFSKINVSLLMDGDKQFLRKTLERVTNLPYTIRKTVGTPELWYRLGRLEAKLDDKESAEQFCRLAIFQNPNNSNAWYNLGTVLTDRTEQERCYRKVIELDPNDIYAWINLGTLLTDKAEQVRCYRKAIELDPKYSNAWNNLGTVLTDKAEKKRCYRKAIELDPNNITARNNLKEM